MTTDRKEAPVHAEPVPWRTGCNDRKGREICLGDRVRLVRSGPDTKEEYWNPEFVVEWEPPSFVLRHVGGGKASDDAAFEFRNSRHYLETVSIAPRPPTDAAEIERLRAEVSRLGRDLNRARYGEPDFAWAIYKSAIADLQRRAEKAEADRDTALARVAALKLRLKYAYAVKTICNDEANELRRELAALTPLPDTGLDALFGKPIDNRDNACELCADAPATRMSNGDLCCEDCYTRRIERTLETALRARPAGVTAKPLVWVMEPDRPADYPKWTAETSLGKPYHVFKAWWGAQDKWGFVGIDSFYRTEGAAKAAAQSDFEARIRAALTRNTVQEKK